MASVGSSWQTRDASPAGSPPPGRGSGDDEPVPATPAGARSSASSDHRDWRPRLRSPSPEPGPGRSPTPELAPARSRSPRPVWRLPPRPPAPRTRSQRAAPEPARSARRAQPCPACGRACATQAAPRQPRRTQRARPPRGACSATSSAPFGTPPGPSPFLPFPASGSAPAPAAHAPHSDSAHRPQAASPPPPSSRFLSASHLGCAQGEAPASGVRPVEKDRGSLGSPHPYPLARRRPAAGIHAPLLFFVLVPSGKPLPSKPPPYTQTPRRLHGSAAVRPASVIRNPSLCEATSGGQQLPSILVRASEFATSFLCGRAPCGRPPR